MQKVNKRLLKDKLRLKADEIINRVIEANKAFVIYKSMPSLKNYINFKNLVDKFYLDGAKNDKSIFGMTPKKMLKSFRHEFPKCYKEIVKRLSKMGINHLELLLFSRSHLDAFIKKQEDRRRVVSELKAIFLESDQNNYSEEIIKEGFLKIDNKIQEIEDEESRLVKPELTEISFAELFKTSMKQACEEMCAEKQVSKRMCKKQSGKKNKKTSTKVFE